jgi:hypothetical protein
MLNMLMLASFNISDSLHSLILLVLFDGVVGAIIYRKASPCPASSIALPSGREVALIAEVPTGDPLLVLTGLLVSV